MIKQSDQWSWARVSQPWSAGMPQECSPLLHANHRGQRSALLYRLSVCLQDRLLRALSTTQRCMSGLEALSKREHQWGCLMAPQHRHDCYPPPIHTHTLTHTHTHTHTHTQFPPPLPLCASSIVPECHGLNREAGLSTGIYKPSESACV